MDVPYDTIILSIDGQYSALFVHMAGYFNNAALLDDWIMNIQKGRYIFDFNLAFIFVDYFAFGSIDIFFFIKLMCDYYYYSNNDNNNNCTPNSASFLCIGF